MSPISTERLEWIDERLFILARMVQTLRREGLQTSSRYFTASAQEAYAIFNASLQDMNTERLTLMMERAAISEYLEDQKRGS